MHVLRAIPVRAHVQHPPRRPYRFVVGELYTICNCYAVVERIVAGVSCWTTQVQAVLVLYIILYNIVR